MDSIANLIKQYQLLTDWYLSVLEDIDVADGHKTITDNTNSLEWLAGHLITGRYRNIIRLGITIEPYEYIDKFINQAIPPPNAIAFNKMIQYPSLNDCKQQWIRYGKLFMNRLKEIKVDTLRTEIPFTVMTGGNTIEDALTFIVLHETFHIGQMSIIRKALGYPAMQLSPRKAPVI